MSHFLHSCPRLSDVLKLNRLWYFIHGVSNLDRQNHCCVYNSFMAAKDKLKLLMKTARGVLIWISWHIGWCWLVQTSTEQHPEGLRARGPQWGDSLILRAPIGRSTVREPQASVETYHWPRTLHTSASTALLLFGSVARLMCDHVKKVGMEMRCFSLRVWMIGLLTNCGASISYGGLSGNGSCHHVPTIVLLLWCVNPCDTMMSFCNHANSAGDNERKRNTAFLHHVFAALSTWFIFQLLRKTTRPTENLTCS